MNSVEKTTKESTQYATPADLLSTLNSLPSDVRLALAESILRDHPRVALYTIITEDELTEYYRTRWL